MKTAGLLEVVCAAAVQRTLDSCCDSCDQSVTANLLIGRMKLRDREEGDCESSRDEQRKRRVLRLSAPCFLHGWQSDDCGGACSCMVCVCGADF